MGVEYQHWILPRDRAFRPSLETFARLIEEMLVARWLVDDRAYSCATVYDRTPGCKKRQRRPITSPITAEWLSSRIDEASPRAIDHELALYFPTDVDDGKFETWDEANIRFPFTVGKEETSNYHEYQLVLADDFVAHGYINGFDTPLEGTCACGKDLLYNVETEHPDALSAYREYTRRIRRVCPACSTHFDPLTRTQSMYRAYGAPIEELRGGVTFRFAIRIDCHKGWPRSEEQLALEPALLALIERVLGTPVEDVGAFY